MPTLKWFLGIFIFIYSHSGSTNPLVEKNKAFRTIWHPTYQGNRLAYCDGEGCGKPVADEYCHLLGYECSWDHIIAHNLGLTHSLTKREQCSGWECDGFLLINCMADIRHVPPKPYHYREKEFIFPRLNDYRVDWCYMHSMGCGARAANAFCSHLGYLKAIYFEKQCPVQATQAIGNQELCFGEECSSFKRIVCFR